MVTPRSFPSPPDLSELLQFFQAEEAQARNERLARRHRESGGGPSRRAWEPPPRQRSSKPRQMGVSFDSLTPPPRTVEKNYVKPTRSSTRRATRSVSPRRIGATAVATLRPKQTTPPKTRGRYDSDDADAQQQQQRTLDWNGSTQVDARAARQVLRHQILCRKYEPPASMVVAPAETPQLVARLAKTTVSSRMKGQTVVSSGPRSVFKSVEPPPAPQTTDTRAQDAIQTLLLYRLEVSKRLGMDPT